jgi:hypothetical protein
MPTTSSASRNFPTLRYLAAPFRWLLRSRRRVATVVAVFLAMIAALPLWWSIQLLGLPDIGEPFDLEAFRSFRIPDDRNAFVLYRQAAAALKPLKSLVRPTGVPANQPGPWPKDDAEARRWVEENREAMELYRRGTERPDALDLVPPNSPQSGEMLRTLRSFHVLAQLAAGSLEQQGDMAGAWDWYRTAFRATDRLGLHGVLTMRVVAQRWHAELQGRVVTWAADPRTTPAMLRQALDDAIAFGAVIRSESYTLMAEYAQLEAMLDSPQNPSRYVPLMPLYRRISYLRYFVGREQMLALSDAWRFWRREPERSRRVLRLVFANWLAYDALPPERRPAPDPKLSGSYDFYAFGPEAPAGARALSPVALDRWLASTTDASEMLRGMSFQGIHHLQERSNHRALVVLLARALYRRDHGADPPSDQALVGPYLERLPNDGSDSDEPGPAAGAATRAPGSTGQE